MQFWQKLSGSGLESERLSFWKKTISGNKCMKSYSVAREFVVPKVNIRCDILGGYLRKDLWFVCVAYPLGSGRLREDQWGSTPCSPAPTDPKCQWTLCRSSTRPGKKKTRCVWNHRNFGHRQWIISSFACDDMYLWAAVGNGTAIARRNERPPVTAAFWRFRSGVQRSKNLRYSRLSGT